MSGATTADRFGGSLVGGIGSGGRFGFWSHGSTEPSVVVRDFDAGNFRTVAGTTGWGRRVATSNSSSRFVLCRAAASNSRLFSAVRCVATRQTAVSVSAPSASRSSSTGKRRAARAASMRPYAACSERCSTWVQ